MQLADPTSGGTSPKEAPFIELWDIGERRCQGHFAVSYISAPWYLLAVTMQVRRNAISRSGPCSWRT